MDGSDGMDLVARQIASGAYEAPLPHPVMAALLRTEGLLVDVGANTGVDSCIAGTAAQDRRIIAFEPLPPIVGIPRRFRLR